MSKSTPALKTLPDNSKNSGLSPLASAVIVQLCEGVTPFQLVTSGVFKDPAEARQVFSETTDYFTAVSLTPTASTKGLAMTAAMKVFHQLQDVGDFAGSLRALETYWKIAKNK